MKTSGCTLRTHLGFLGFAIVGIVALSLAATSASAQTIVTTCAQEVSGDVVLAADLDCTGLELGDTSYVNESGNPGQRRDVCALD